MAKSSKKLNKSWLWTILFLLIIAFVARAVFLEVSRRKLLDQEIAEREEEIARVFLNIEELSEEIKDSSDVQQIEKEARRTLNLKKEGEEVFVVVGIDDVSRPEDFSSVFESSFVESGGVWLNIKKWWFYFFK